MRTAVSGLLATILLAGLVPAATEAAEAAPSRSASTGTVHLGRVAVPVSAGTRQLVTVKHTRGYHARVAYWVKTPTGWDRRMLARDGRIGYGGLVAGSRRHQGTGTTPLGTYRLLWAFGTHAKRASWDLGYRRIHRGDYWVEDNGSDYYNRYRNKRQGGFRWWLPASNENSSERLTDFPRQYEFSIVTSFNHRQVRHRGAGIFLHVNGSGATAGCVSAPRWFIKSLMARLDKTKAPVISISR